MEMLSKAACGTLESGDIYIEIEKIASGIDVQLKSTVMDLYGARIAEVIRSTVAEMGLDGVRVTATDKGALDCTVQARTKTAVFRACGSEDYNW